jgi:methylated-DNA-[protein]-cysteine S-methyltransferase
LTEFQQKVQKLCRQIPFGTTMTYGELAAKAGAPGAARAVGICMARNCFPLVVPCHRVVPAGGRLGNYSAPGGTETKQRLLDMERLAKS